MGFSTIHIKQTSFYILVIIISNFIYFIHLVFLMGIFFIEFSFQRELVREKIKFTSDERNMKMLSVFDNLTKLNIYIQS